MATRVLCRCAVRMIAACDAELDEHRPVVDRHQLVAQLGQVVLGDERSRGADAELAALGVGWEGADPRLDVAERLRDRRDGGAQGLREAVLGGGAGHGGEHPVEVDPIGEALALPGVGQGDARLDGEHLQQLAVGLVGHLAVRRQVDGHVAEELAGGGVERRVERVLRVPGGGVGTDLDLGDPGRLQPLLRHPAGGHEAEDAPPVRLPELVEDLLGRGPPVEDLGDDLGRTGDVGHHEHVAFEASDGGDAVAEDVHDAMGDLLEDHLGVGGGVDPTHELGESAERSLATWHAHLPTRRTWSH